VVGCGEPVGPTVGATGLAPVGPTVGATGPVALGSGPVVEFTGGAGLFDSLLPQAAESSAAPTMPRSPFILFILCMSFMSSLVFLVQPDGFL
jgi:hypothetical protein